MGKLVVLTGLDGSGTSSIARYLHASEPGSKILEGLPAPFTLFRDSIDRSVRAASPAAHYLFYLSAMIYASTLVEEMMLNCNGNIYCVRYLIDTVVSHRVAGLPVTLEYETELYRIRKPDLTIFLSVNESIRQSRLKARGKSYLDKVLDDDNIRDRFLKEFDKFSDQFVVVDNSERFLEEVVTEIRRYL